VSAALERIGRDLPDAFVGMDVIVGFPGEGEDEFADTYARLNDAPWTRIHVFPYSERPGTFAVRLSGKVPSHIIDRRADRLRGLSRERYLASAHKQMGLVKKALILKNGRALSRDYWSLHFDPAAIPEVGQERKLRVTGFAPSKSRMEPALSAELVID
jgi:threonylcarbamoyladenosine tRNA methylthiotransferase MtaB